MRAETNEPSPEQGVERFLEKDLSMTNIEDKQRANAEPADTSKGPVAGGTEHKPKIDPTDGSEIEAIVSEHQTATGPKSDK
jgi:hypothetical protein